ncbi:hypothetical protein KP509_39G013600 [Ceratopteris richardii]|nr:hypothetical protein KP509_39G013600 [Ceratopteris richardii]
MEDFMDTIKHVHKLQYSWLLVATAKSLQLMPFKMHIRDGFWVNEHNQSVKSLEVQAYANQFGVWKGCNSRYLWAWSTEHVPLHVGVTPSFVYGHGFHDEWLLNEALSSGIRFVFDASDAISAFYLTRESNSYGEVGDAASLYARKNIWERDNNAHLAALYGSFYFRPVDFVNMPPKLISCVNHGLKVFQFIYPQSDMNPAIESREIPSIEGPHLSEMIKLSIKFQSTNKSFSTSFRRFSRQKRSTRYICPTEIEKSFMGFKSLKKKLISGNLKVQCDCNNVFQEAIDCKSSNMKWLPKIRLDRSSYESASFSLESLLALVSDENKIIVLSVVGYNYKDMLMSWVCRLRKLQISSYVIGAIDKQLYEFGILQGLPVFMVGKSMDVSFNDCHFGTECFKKVTKMKSRVVLQVLKLGYRVLFSDVDVYWFKNPIDYLMSFGPGTLVAQSDEWHIKGAPNKPRHLNSGFYFVWPDSSTIAAFEAIVMHASLSNMSEQPSFYDVLCGISGVHRVGATQCLDLVTNVTTHFLDRELFPNGAYKELWEKKNVSDACILQGCYVLHNNWVSGRQRKLNRQIASGLWDYDVKNRICMRS